MPKKTKELGDLIEPTRLKVGWRPDEFAAAIGSGRTFVERLIKSRAIESVKLGTAQGAPRIITTSPSDYLKSLADQAA
ncbi:MAG TPA: hypothetical protein VJ890_20450 [Vineibacter sp.]|nr:hypothetical protein [Vineibacter sp.]